VYTIPKRNNYSLNSNKKKRKMATILKLAIKNIYPNYQLFLAQGLAVIFSHHQVCIKKKKGGHFLGGQKGK
jgi:hypothetical protein